MGNMMVSLFNLRHLVYGSCGLLLAPMNSAKLYAGLSLSHTHTLTHAHACKLSINKELLLHSFYCYININGTVFFFERILISM